MPQTRKRIRPQDSKRINVDEISELSYWTSSLGVSRERLIAVVNEVGSSVALVKQVLKERLV